MASYKIILDKQVRKKDLPPIPAKDRLRIIARIEALANNPYPADSIQLTGSTVRRVRQGNYRILYAVDTDVITIRIAKVGHRRDVYR